MARRLFQLTLLRLRYVITSLRRCENVVYPQFLNLTFLIINMSLHAYSVHQANFKPEVRAAILKAVTPVVEKCSEENDVTYDQLQAAQIAGREVEDLPIRFLECMARNTGVVSTHINLQYKTMMMLFNIINEVCSRVLLRIFCQNLN